MENTNFDKTMVFPVLVLLLSISTVLDNLAPPNYFSIIVSVIGIIGGVLFFYDKGVKSHWLEIWLFLQIPYLTKTMVDANTGMELFKPIVDASQTLRINIGLHFGSPTDRLDMGLNILPFIVMAILHFLKIPYKKPIGSAVQP